MSTGALDPLIHDPERLRVAAALGEHFAQGRLTLDELDARLDATLTATTHGEQIRERPPS
jgi:alkyl hydroperoxide reductase subunit AhpF